MVFVYYAPLVVGWQINKRYRSTSDLKRKNCFKTVVRLDLSTNFAKFSCFGNSNHSSNMWKTFVSVLCDIRHLTTIEIHITLLNWAGPSCVIKTNFECMICHVQKQGLVEIKYGKKNYTFFSVFLRFNRITYSAFQFFFSRRLKFPCSRRKFSLKKHLSLLFVPEFKTAISAGKTIFQFANDKGAINIVGVFVATVPCMITNFQLFVSSQKNGNVLVSEWKRRGILIRR